MYGDAAVAAFKQGVLTTLRSMLQMARGTQDEKEFRAALIQSLREAAHEVEKGSR